MRRCPPAGTATLRRSHPGEGRTTLLVVGVAHGDARMGRLHRRPGVEGQVPAVVPFGHEHDAGAAVLDLLGAWLATWLT